LRPKRHETSITKGKRDWAEELKKSRGWIKGLHVGGKDLQGAGGSKLGDDLKRESHTPEIKKEGKGGRGEVRGDSLNHKTIKE